MLGTLALVLSAPVHAETLPIDLGDKTATVTTPNASEVKVVFAPVGEGDSVRWGNDESTAFAVVCGTEGKEAEDSFVEQVILAVGDKKWGLAAGSSVKMTCAGGKPATVTDIHGTALGTFAGGVKVTIDAIKSRAAR